jgi:Zn-dependent protease/CBS domain-containing protein
MACLLLHELAHGLTARRAGVQVEDMTVWALGGVTRAGQPKSPKAAAATAAAGPLTSLGLGLLLLGAGLGLHSGPHWSIPAAVLAWLGGANLLLGLFNLLPAAPMDGGRILQALLWWNGQDRDRAEQMADRVGQVVGLALACLGTAMLLTRTADGLWLMLTGLFLATGAGAERRRAALESALRGVRVADAMSDPVVTGPDWITVERFRTEVAAHTRHSTLALTDFDGHASGLVTRRLLAAVPQARRDDVRVRDIMVPLAMCATAAPDDPLAETVQRLTAPAGSRILVLYDRRPVGIVTGHDIARLLQDHALGLAPADITGQSGSAVRTTEMGR